MLAVVFSVAGLIAAIGVSVHYSVIYLALERAADSIVFFASYDTELVEVVHH
jgi:hypothetical protein